jgi:hypothetical protein
MRKGERIDTNTHPVESKMSQLQRTVFRYFVQDLMQCRCLSRYAIRPWFDLEMDQLRTFGYQSCKTADDARRAVDVVTREGNFLQPREMI